MTKKIAKSPFYDLILDKEEQEIKAALARGEYRSTKNLAAVKKLFLEAARNTAVLQKSKRITIRVNHLDLLRVRAKAKQNNIPYQTLLGVLIHRYATDEARLRI